MLSGDSEIISPLFLQLLNNDRNATAACVKSILTAVAGDLRRKCPVKECLLLIGP